ncbi:hypothetical protein AGMMS50293_17190 [Spirochaetia bacterium]|nr:hypothetical protein AGMMS50293_17190 [Spirochaetia bacterium]
MKTKLLFLLLIPALFPVFAEPLYSPAWGFRLDLPEGYEFTDGDGKDRFSFAESGGAQFDIRVYNGAYKTMKDMVDDVGRRLKNQGDVTFFEYRDKLAAIMELRFEEFSGWGLCVELAGSGNGTPPMLLALSYGPVGKRELELLHLSALDSIVPSNGERHYPGPIMEFGFPRGEQKRTALAKPGISAIIRENDAEAAQALIDREFALLRKYQFLENWQEAWIRFYRVIYRDSWDRVADAVFQLERSWNQNPGEAATASGQAERTLAEKALAWVQTFKYERDLMGSDFVNLVSAVTEGRGDCDSRAMLWALILAQADIPAAIMVSREHNHAMGLADIAGTGARFEAKGIKWLVAETTAQVNIGLIGQDVSDIESWLGVIFE